uniref:Uncharacterized protein n=1 Tax=Acrobeloides nanus TaxID=290746 RepID=A0A914BZL0_9BILA
MMFMYIFPLLFLKFISAQKQIPFLYEQFHDSLTAYGPGLAVFSPYSYVDLFYDNIPFVGKIGTLGKEGTSSHTGISPYYPPFGNPSVPFPPLYKARPLPPHVPEPTEVVAVPLDEQALQGEPLFPKELTLPWLMEKAVPKEDQEKEAKSPFDDETDRKPTKDPFKSEELSEEIEPENLVRWPASTSELEKISNEGKVIKLPRPKLQVLQKQLSV